MSAAGDNIFCASVSRVARRLPAASSRLFSIAEKGLTRKPCKSLWGSLITLIGKIGEDLQLIENMVGPLLSFKF
jgi:hypothetical protein